MVLREVSEDAEEHDVKQYDNEASDCEGDKRRAHNVFSGLTSFSRNRMKMLSANQKQSFGMLSITGDIPSMSTGASSEKSA